MGFFPVDQETLDFLQFTNRDAGLVALVEAYTKEQGLFRTDETPDPVFADSLELDLSTVTPSMAGPKRPQDRVELPEVKGNFHAAFPGAKSPAADTLGNGAVVIAAITSCTNTSNPSVMLAAGLVARNAVARGLKVKPWVKTSLAPGSKVVADYYREAGLMTSLEALNFHLGGFWLHDMYWQQRSPARRSHGGYPEGQPGGGGGAERKSQFRRPHQPAGEGQLPGFAAPGGGPTRWPVPWIST
jgi:aconitate hydratase